MIPSIISLKPLADKTYDNFVESKWID
jgi:hypothetical protein